MPGWRLAANSSLEKHEFQPGVEKCSLVTILGV